MPVPPGAGARGGHGGAEVELELARAVLGTEAPLGGRGTGPPAVAAHGKTETSEDAALSVGPNPASSRAAVVLALAEPAEVTVTVYDLLGRAVAVPLAGALAAGTHRASVDASALAPGVYVVRVSADGSGANPEAGPVVQTVRLTVVR